MLIWFFSHIFLIEADMLISMIQQHSSDVDDVVSVADSDNMSAANDDGAFITAEEVENDETLPLAAESQQQDESDGMDQNQVENHESENVAGKENIRPQSTPVTFKNVTVISKVPVATFKPVVQVPKAAVTAPKQALAEKNDGQVTAESNEPEAAEQKPHPVTQVFVAPSAVNVLKKKKKGGLKMKLRAPNVVVPGQFVRKRKFNVDEDAENDDDDDETEAGEEEEPQQIVSESGALYVRISGTLSSPMKQALKRAKKQKTVAFLE